MKNHWIALIPLCLVTWSLPAADQRVVAVGESVLRLLKDRDVKVFAEALSITNQGARIQVANSA